MTYSEIRKNEEVLAFIKKEMRIWKPWDSPIIRRRIRDQVQIVSAIGLHDESTGGATDPISAALMHRR